MKDPDEKKSFDRRSFFRTLSLGTLGATFTYLFAKAAASGDCFGNSTCRSCSRKDGGCELPLVIEYRKKQQALKEKQRQKNIAQLKDPELLRLLKLKDDSNG